MSTKNDMETYSTNNEGKSDVAERLIKTLKSKTYKCMTSTSKIMYIDKLNDIVKKYNNTYHSRIKMKPVAVKSSTYVDFHKKNNTEDPKFKAGDHVVISKYKSIFEKGFISNWSEAGFSDCKNQIYYSADICY